MSLIAESEDFLSLWDNVHQDDPDFPQDIPEETLLDLASWVAANSNSYDQSNLRVGRLLMQLLIDRRKNHLCHVAINQGGDDADSFRTWPGHPREGEKTGHESFRDDDPDSDNCSTCVFYRNERDKPMMGICALWQHLLSVEPGYLYATCDNHTENDGTDSPPFEARQGRVGRKDLKKRFVDKKDMRSSSRVLVWLHNNGMINFNDRNEVRIPSNRLANIDLILAELHTGATIGLDSRWDLYITGRYGGRDTTESAPLLIRGSTTLPPVIGFDLHIVLGEVVSRLVADREKSTDGWGVSQYDIRAKLCSLASDAGRDHITIEEYYQAFRDGGASHMADTYLFRSFQDKNAAVFQLIPGSEETPPHYGCIQVDPLLMRWHERSRTRTHLVGGAN